MKARTLFPDPDDYTRVKSICQQFNGTVVKVIDREGRIVYDSLGDLHKSKKDLNNV